MSRRAAAGHRSGATMTIPVMPTGGSSRANNADGLVQTDVRDNVCSLGDRAGAAVVLRRRARIITVQYWDEWATWRFQFIGWCEARALIGTGETYNHGQVPVKRRLAVVS